MFSEAELNSALTSACHVPISQRCRQSQQQACLHRGCLLHAHTCLVFLLSDDLQRRPAQGALPTPICLPACPTGQQCVNGQCTCPPGLDLCYGSCVVSLQAPDLSLSKVVEQNSPTGSKCCFSRSDVSARVEHYCGACCCKTQMCVYTGQLFELTCICCAPCVLLPTERNS